MQRDLTKLSDQTFDLLIIGGGIYGAFAAWDAASRGIRTALVERGDFGQETSANSMRVIHGGLRYLQDGNLPLVRRMILERHRFLRMAPHLVQPLPFLIPTYGYGVRSRAAMAVALRMNDWMGIGLNGNFKGNRIIPASKVVSAERYIAEAPGKLPGDRLTGAGMWYDGQVLSAEGLNLGIIRTAARSGAVVANYVEAVRLLQKEDRVVGALLCDAIGGDEFRVQAKVTLNAAGPWIDGLLNTLEGWNGPQLFHPSLAFNVVLDGRFSECGIGFPTQWGIQDNHFMHFKHTPTLFIVPWGNKTMIGTVHLPFQGGPEDLEVSDKLVGALLTTVNNAFPGVSLKPEQVHSLQMGLLPVTGEAAAEGDVRLIRQSLIYDHSMREGYNGLITLLGVKYSMARWTAEIVVDRIQRLLDRDQLPCITGDLPIIGGSHLNLESLQESFQSQIRDPEQRDVVGHLVHSYGSDYPRVLSVIQETHQGWERLGEGLPFTRGEVRFITRETMAQTLKDLIYRRTSLGIHERVDGNLLKSCSRIMASELGWSEARRQRELDSVLKASDTTHALVV